MRKKKRNTCLKVMKDGYTNLLNRKCSKNNLNSQYQTYVHSLIHVLYYYFHSSIDSKTQVCLWSKYTVVSQPTIEEKAACFACLLRIAITCWNIGNFNASKEIIDGLR